MFDIGFSELLLISIVGLVVLGPQRLPVAIRTVMGWVRTIRGLAANVQNELSQELKLQELQESIKKAEHLNLQQLSPELSQTLEELKASAEKIKANLEEKAAITNFEQQVQELKSAVQNSQEISPNNASLSTEEQDLSPADIAELAEQDESQLELTSAYYPEDDVLADVGEVSETAKPTPAHQAEKG
ncbi:Sec-independent protein translocase protein TatB [Avibacterium paragallinarum]|uniref:Sec-independent protein translocase protein TatB n=1 Tax=Avibacterium paragallinarum TaxID=728 RepID=A0A0F5F2A7_AVIPA|nr:Sec-independent protein translocase protein TatB [Avibacterium paragallinarum]KAA6210145.1 Sec-independent protein translocase subunit TatB [Avibacterium paragallinarum]KKB02327.1 preprotein translocase subunit TatB [Avibacterium paragallinarum]RZN61336.1 Sec-independent protein translocase subunit TatB [Avibacterium paragallinarum]RZN74304.1 Sec-independent protein translocase subunit TatB [Avibacterium paragallinarum]SUV40581.1 Sec-independent protein translocase protein TatB [Avibacteriu